MAKMAVIVTLAVACFAIAQPSFGQGSSAATAGGAASTASGSTTTTNATDGGASAAGASSPDSASAAASVTAAAAATGGMSTLTGLAPAATIVKPVLPATLQTAFTGVVVDQVVSFSEKYCTPASFKEGVAKPANYTGPGMTISFTTGSCKVPASDVSTTGGSGGSSASGSASSGTRKLQKASASGSATGKNSSASAAASGAAGVGGSSGSILNCLEPSLVVTKTPAIYTSAYTSAPTFTGKECMVAPTVGDATAEVLYTFDEAAPVDPLSLANLIQAKLATILQEGYQDLIKQIASSATFSVTGAPAGGSSTASAAAAGR